MKRQMKKQSVTLKDVAEKTGYSVNTVSHALRGKDDIAKTTAEKIRKVAKEMGYINNTVASSLRLGYTNTIALIVGDISNPHFAIMAKEIETRAGEYGYSAFLLNTNENSETELLAIKTAIHKNVDGIIICPTQENEENTQFLLDSGVPFIQIGRRSDNPEINYVVCDDVQGGYLATRHLLMKGHKRVLFLVAPAYISSSRERYEGYEMAYREMGLEVDPQLIREISVTENNVEQVMEKVKEESIDFSAIFAFSDNVAWAAWTWLYRHGYQVPRDISLIGFDYIQSRLPFPYQLSTIGTSKTKMSVTAVDCLLQKIDPDIFEENTCQTICHHVLPTILVEGETVKEFRK